MQITKYTAKQACKELPTRNSSDNKTRGGKCLVIAGSKNMWGAAVLCGEGAVRIGAGYVYIYNVDKKFPFRKYPDFLWQNKNDFSQFQAIAIGPGYKKAHEIRTLIRQLLKLKFKNVVLDAEALNVVALMKIKLPESWILTPHEGELSRMLAVSSSEIRKNRQKFVEVAQKKWNCVVLLKGHRTLIANGKSVFEIQSGNAALAKAGTGDVLTGMILGLLSQRLNAIDSACLASYLHGRCADIWTKQNDVLSLRATDLIDLLPQIIKKLRR
jgi:ADP-dependent NAD(P)H-hydrate dehydratase